jgi:hypothetical protein
MTPAIIVDFDGTLYDCEERRKLYLDGPKKNFDAFNAAANHDPIHVWCGQLVKAMWALNHDIIFVSGRDATYHDDAVEWLRRNLNMRLGDYALFMRPAGDYCKDTELKQRIYDTYIKGTWEVVFAIDDRKCVVDFWRSLGIPCLHCAEGDF